MDNSESNPKVFENSSFSKNIICFWTLLQNRKQIQKTNTALFQDATFRASLAPQVSDYQLTIPANYSDDMQINVAWVDKRMTDSAENQISLNASFPDLTAVCS